MGKWRASEFGGMAGWRDMMGKRGQFQSFRDGAEKGLSQSGRPARLEGAPGVEKRCPGARGGGPLNAARGRSAPASESSETRAEPAHRQRVRFRFIRQTGTRLLLRLGNAPFNDQTWIRIGWSRRSRWRAKTQACRSMPAKGRAKATAGDDELLKQVSEQLKEMRVKAVVESGQGLHVGQAMERAAALERTEREQQDQQRAKQDADRQNAMRMEAAIEFGGMIAAQLHEQGQAPEVSKKAIHAVQRGTAGVGLELANIAVRGIYATAHVPTMYNYKKGEAVQNLMTLEGAQVRLQFPVGSDIDDVKLGRMLKKYSVGLPQFMRLSGESQIVLWRNPNLKSGQEPAPQLVQGTELTFHEYGMTVQTKVYHPKQEARLVMDEQDLAGMHHILETLNDMGLTYLQAEEYLTEQLRRTIGVDTALAADIRYVRIDNGQRLQERWVNLPMQSAAAKNMRTKILVGLSPERLAELDTYQQEMRINIVVGDLALHEARVHLQAPEQSIAEKPEMVIMNRQRRERLGSRDHLHGIAEQLGQMTAASPAQEVYQQIRPKVFVLPEATKRAIEPMLQALIQAAHRNDKLPLEKMQQLKQELERFVDKDLEKMWQEETANQTLLQVTPKSMEFWAEIRQAVPYKERIDEQAWKQKLWQVLEKALGVGVIRDIEIALEADGRFYPKSKTSFVMLYEADKASALSLVRGKPAFSSAFEVRRIEQDVAKTLSTKTALEALQTFFEQNAAKGVWVPARVEGMGGVDVKTSMQSLRSDGQKYGKYDIRALGEELQLPAEEDNKLLEALVKLQKDGRVMSMQPEVGKTTLFLSMTTYNVLRHSARDQAWLQKLAFGEDVAEVILPMLERLLEDMILYAAADGAFIEGKDYIQQIQDHGELKSVDGPKSMGNTIQQHPFMQGGVEQAARKLGEAVRKLLEEKQLEVREADGCTLLIRQGQLYTITSETAAELQPQNDIEWEAFTWQGGAEETVAEIIREYMRKNMVLRLPKEAEGSWSSVAAMTGPALRFRRVPPPQVLAGGWSRVYAPRVEQRLEGSMEDVVELTDLEWRELGEPQMQLGARVITKSGVWQLAPQGTLEDIFPECHLPVVYPYIKMVLGKMTASGEVWSTDTSDGGTIVIGLSGNGTDGEARFRQTLEMSKAETRGVRGKATTTLAMLDHTRAQTEYAKLQEMVYRLQSAAMDKWLEEALPIFVTTYKDEIAERFMRKEAAGYPSATPSFLFTDWGERQLRQALEESVHSGEIGSRKVSNGTIFIDESLADTLHLTWEKLVIGANQGQELKEYLETEHRLLKKRGTEAQSGRTAEEEETESMRDVGDTEQGDEEDADSSPPKKK